MNAHSFAVPSVALRSGTYIDVMNEITATTEEFLRLGVAVFSQDSTDGRRRETLLTADVSVSKYLRAVAKEFQRPFAVVHRYRYLHWQNKDTPVSSAALSFPNTKRMNILASPLLLVCSEDSKAPVHRRSSKSRYEFRFNGDGMSFLDSWLELCRTDESFKVALGTT